MWKKTEKMSPEEMKREGMVPDKETTVNLFSYFLRISERFGGTEKEAEDSLIELLSEIWDSPDKQCPERRAAFVKKFMGNPAYEEFIVFMAEQMEHILVTARFPFDVDAYYKNFAKEHNISVRGARRAFTGAIKTICRNPDKFYPFTYELAVFFKGKTPTNEEFFSYIEREGLTGGIENAR